MQAIIRNIKPWYPYPWEEDGNYWDTRLASQRPELKFRRFRRSRYAERQKRLLDAMKHTEACDNPADIAHCPSEAESLEPMVAPSGIYDEHAGTCDPYDEPATDDHLVEGSDGE